MRFLLILFLLLAGPLAAAPRVALVMGAEAYQGLRPLQNPRADAGAVGEMLAGMGFEVTYALDPDLGQMRAALQGFAATAKGAEVALVFYGGHGVEIGGVNYLMPVDGRAASAAEVAASALPLNEVQAVLAAAKAGVVLLDACREDPFGGGSGQGRAAAPLDDPEAPAPRPGLGRMGRADGVVFAFSAAPGEVASDGQGDHSPFAAALLRHFPTAGAELRMALTLVQQDVYDRSRGRQLPYIESGLPQMVYLTGPGDLAERERLLLAMAAITPEMRAEVEALAVAQDLPLAPLYAALVSADLASLTADERANALAEAAAGYRAFKAGLAGFGSEDPEVAALRRKAEAALGLGELEAARQLLDRAAALDAAALAQMTEGVQARSASLAQTRILSAGAATADLRWDLVVAALTEATDLLAGIDGPGLDPDLRAAHASALWDLGDAQARLGDTAAALASYQRWLVLDRARLQDAPQDGSVQRDLMVVLRKLAQMQALRGDLAAAVAGLRESLTMAQGLAVANPDDPSVQRDVVIGLNRLGDTLRTMGDSAGTEAVFVQALDLTKALSARFPGDRDLRSDLAVAYALVGRYRLETGVLTDVTELMAQSAAISADLARAAPEDAVAQRQWGLALVMQGDAAVAEGQHEAALAQYQQALGVLAPLAAQDPGHAEAQRDLATVQSKIGDANYLLGRAQPAFDAYTLSLEITQALAARDPGNVQWQVDLAISHYLLAGASSDRVNEMNRALEILDRLQAEGQLPGAFADLAGKMRAEMAGAAP